MKTCIRLVVYAWALVMAGGASGQFPVSEIKLRTDPADARVRPLESVTIQVLVYGEMTEGEDEDDAKRIRLQTAGARLEIEDSNGGWLSKPFRYQGEEAEPFYEAPGAGLAKVLLGRATGEFVLRDSVLYTAPNRPGKYKIEANLDGKTDKVTIHVDPDAPPRRTAERVNFPKEPSSLDPYRRLVEHYAPFVAQETWFQPKSDYLARFDFDGDWRGDNNWRAAEEGTSQAYVYYAVMETETHWFLIYNFFHPRDYSDRCVAGTCHENDNEGLILTVEKDRSPFGRLLVMETLAHNNVYSYPADRRVTNKIHNPDGTVELYQDSHPVVFIESGGHGVYGSTDNHARFSLRGDEFTAGTGVAYVYKGVAERPQHTNDRDVGYELLPIYEHWWLRAHPRGASGNHTFDDYYPYQPYGSRPRPPHSEIAGAFLGREFGVNKAKPFWGWHDRRTRKRDVLATGQWGLDPAYSVWQNLELPRPFSLRYVFNPYLGVGKPPAVSQVTASETELPPVVTGGGYLPESRTSAVSHFRARRSDKYDPRAKEGRFDLHLIVDGETEIYVQGDMVGHKALSGRPPKDAGSDYTQPIPQATFRKFKLEKKEGRGKVALLEEPSAANDFTAKLRISDPRGGDDEYHARLEWEWDELTPVSSQGSSTSDVLSKHLEPFHTEDEVKGEELFSDDNDPRDYDRNDDSGDFEFRGRVDGTAILRIRGDQVFAEMLDGRPVAVDRFKFSQPLPGSRLRKIELERKDGRGEIVLLERPWEENGFRAVIRISDPKGGDDRYHFRLKWEK